MYIEYTWPPYFIPALGLSLKSVVLIPYLPWNRGAGAPSSRAAPGVVTPTAPGGLGGDGAGSAVFRCFQCCIQFLSLMLLLFYHCTTRFMLSCSCWLSNDACYIPWFYQLRVFLYKMPCQKWRNKTVKSNQSIISYHKHINFLCYIQQNWMKLFISLHVQRGLHSYVH